MFKEFIIKYLTDGFRVYDLASWDGMEYNSGLNGIQMVKVWFLSMNLKILITWSQSNTKFGDCIPRYGDRSQVREGPSSEYTVPCRQSLLFLRGQVGMKNLQIRAFCWWTCETRAKYCRRSWRGRRPLYRNRSCSSRRQFFGTH